MAIGNTVRASKFKPNSVWLKDLQFTGNVEQAMWSLTSNSIMNVKYRIFEEEEGKVPNKRVSTKTLNFSNMNESVTGIRGRRSSKSLAHAIEIDTSICMTNASENNYSHAAKSTKTASSALIDESLEKRNSGVKNLIDYYEQTSKSSIATPRTKRGSKNNEDSIIMDDNKSVFSTLSNSGTAKNNRASMDAIKEIKTKTSISSNLINKPPSTIKKEKHRREMSMIYTEDIINPQSSIDLNKSKSVCLPQNNQLIPVNSEESILPEKDDNLPDSFCEAFFIAGLPQENAVTLPGGEDYLSPCRHDNCSMLPSYKPEIISRYPVNNSNRLELNSLSASLCFPLGIKLCYSTNENDIKTVKNYSTAIINQDGSRYYMMTYHFFVKFDNSTFQKTYKINPIKEFLHLERVLDLYENNQDFKKKLELKLEKQLEICTSFNFNETIYLPFSACLISKYPYTKQMERCLQSVIKVMIDKNADEKDIFKLILHLTREIPIPPTNKKLLFFLHNYPSAFELSSPIYKNLPIFNDNLKNLLEIFSVENIIIIHHLMLLEQKILFVCDEYCQLSEVIESFACLLYPMQ